MIYIIKIKQNIYFCNKNDNIYYIFCKLMYMKVPFISLIGLVLAIWADNANGSQYIKKGRCNII